MRQTKAIVAFTVGIVTAICLTTASSGIPADSSGGPVYKYSEILPSQKDRLDLRVAHAPRNTFMVTSTQDDLPPRKTASANSNDITSQPCPPLRLAPITDPRHFVRLAVPQPGENSLLDVDRCFISPNERFLVTSQKIAHGENAVTLYERVGTSGFQYKRAQPEFLSEIALDTLQKGKKEGDPIREASLLMPYGWHGPNDRYLDFDLSVLHGPIAWRGSYDTVTHQFAELKKPVFGPTGPPAPGEQFPETRTRLLTQADVARMNYGKARYAINEIYARHGAPEFFADKMDDTSSLVKYFERFDWYRPDSGLFEDEKVLPRLTANERANLKLLIQRRDALYKAGER